MTSFAPLDLSLYVASPRLSVPSGVALGIALLAARPKPAPAAVRRAGTRLRETVVGLQQDWRRQIAAGLIVTVAPREADTRVDRSIRATFMRLEALTLLRAEAGPDVGSAATAIQRLFPDGLRFLNLPYPQQWAHCDRLLTTLDEDEALAADVERIVGDTTLSEARAAQEAYGVALGITTAPEAVETVSLVTPLDAVRSAIVAYSLQIIAMQSDDPTRLPAARKALAPIDALRAAQARRASGNADAPDSAGTNAEPDPELDDVSVTPDTPVPTLDDEPNVAQ